MEISKDFIGVMPNLSNSDYHASHSHISKSGLDKIAKAPAFYKSELDDPSPVSATTQNNYDWGTAFHTATLEPDLLSVSVAVGPDVATKANKEWKEFVAKNDGKILMTPNDYAEVLLMAENVHNHPRAGNMVSGDVENSVFGRCEHTGVMVKCRPDVMCPGQKVLVDLKSTNDASLDAFSRACFNYRYHVQAALYLDICRAVTGIDYKHFVFVCVEKTKPYMVACYVCSPDMISLGREAYIKDLRLFAWCKETNQWPGYDDSINEIDLPGWAYK